MAGKPAFSPNVEEVDLNKERNLKNTAKIRLLRPNVISFQGFPSEATRCSIRAFKHWKPSPKISFVRMLYVKLSFFHTPHVRIEGFCGIFYSFQELDVFSFVQYLTKHYSDRKKTE
jgi:hypothetical protein